MNHPRTTWKGLTDIEVAESRKKYGSNLLTPPPRESILKLYLEKFTDPLIRILLIAAFLSLVIGIVEQDFLETIGIVLAIFLATSISFWFEYDARKKFDLLNLVNDEIPVKVIRNGNVTEVPRKDLVVGDIILLNTGDEVPADAVLLHSVSLRIDESSLTGEPMTYKTANPEHFTQETTYPPNEILRGSVVMDGHCTARIIRVGDQTEYGKMASDIGRKVEKEIPLNAQLKRLAKLIGVVGFVVALLTFLVLFVKGMVLGHYSVRQWGSSLIVMVSIGIALAKIWLPFIEDALEILHRESRIISYLKKFNWVFMIISGAAFILFFIIIGLLVGIHPLDSANWITIKEMEKILHHFMVAVTIIVVVVPEGLPMSVTLSLALNMRRMLRHNSLVRKMHAVETMGAVNVICTDKTGTLTMNQMEVYDIAFFGTENHPEVRNAVAENIALNSTAHLDLSNPEKPRPIGNPTEAALLLWLHRQGIDYKELRSSFRILEQLTFSTERKYMATLAENIETGEVSLYVKGAPEILFNLSEYVVTGNGLQDKLVIKPEFDALLAGYQNDAMRTLAFASARISGNRKVFEEGKVMASGLQLLAICAISDRLRHDAATAIESCLNAGIDIKMITGDTLGTARKIGRDIGLIAKDDSEDILISGEDFSKLDDSEASRVSQKLKIIYRARPSDKRRLVELLQGQGRVVAVTGDGTNDASALSQAHIGLSMGSGTAVAREASAITIIDDSFHTIANSVMWGRSLYRNIQRFIIFQLTINVAAVLLVFFGSLLGQEVPLTVTQMLWVNLIMDTFAAAALATLSPDPLVMKDKPRRKDDFIISTAMKKNILGKGLLFFLVTLGLFLWFNKRSDGITIKELTVIFTTFVMLQFWNLFNTRVFGTYKSAFANFFRETGFLTVLVVILAGQWIIVEWGGSMFRTVKLPLQDWLLIIGGTFPVLLIGEITRWMKRRRADYAKNLHQDSGITG